MIATVSIGLAASEHRVISVENEPDLEMRYQALPRLNFKMPVTLIDML